jgi:hypothetical protein
VTAPGSAALAALTATLHDLEGRVAALARERERQPVLGDEARVAEPVAQALIRFEARARRETPPTLSPAGSGGPWGTCSGAPSGPSPAPSWSPR